jgi:phosphatidylglycerophosphate synthase
MGVAWRVPEAPLRASVAGVSTIGVIGLAVASWTLQSTLALDAWYPVRAIVGFAVIMLIAFGYTQPLHPFNRFGPANQVTAARAAMVALVAALVGEPLTRATSVLATTVSLAVTLLDGVDGRLARQTKMASAFGARFDMETDALLIMALSVLAWRFERAGLWILLAGLLRYLFVLAGWIDARFAAPLFPSRRRQTVCVIQIVGLSLVVSPFVEAPASGWISAALLATLIWSFAIDTWWLRRSRE